MAVNTSKTKFIVFRTRGKIINPADCVLTLTIMNLVNQLIHP
jgi:hypothetical protein